MSWLSLLVKASYFAAALLFILGIKRMASPKTAASGIRWAGAGMLVATIATFALPGMHNLALIALAVALGAQLLYLAFRFRWTLGASAVAAMAHDVIVLVGVFAWLGKPIDGVFLAVLMGAGNAAGGYVVTERMLEMFKPSAKKEGGA